MSGPPIEACNKDIPWEPEGKDLAGGKVESWNRMEEMEDMENRIAKRFARFHSFHGFHGIP